MNDAFVLVDLPGYGYARISKEKKAEWRPLIEGYLRRAPQLRGIVQLLDVRHEPTDDDGRCSTSWRDRRADDRGADEDRQAEHREAARQSACEIARALALEAEQMIPFSATTGEGRDELPEAIEIAGRGRAP